MRSYNTIINLNVYNHSVARCICHNLNMELVDSIMRNSVDTSLIVVVASWVDFISVKYHIST